MLDTVPIGAAIVAGITLVALVPIRRPRSLAVASWLLAMTVSELPLLYVALIAASAIPELLDGTSSPGSQVELALNALTILGLAILTRRAWRARHHLERALEPSPESAGRTGVDDGFGDRRVRRRPPLRAVLAPWPTRPRAVERASDISYGPEPFHRLDVYRHRSRPTGAPTLIHLHGGRFRWGKKSREARPLLHHLAGRGWTCISADYRLTRAPGDGFPAHLVDVKRLLVWARDHADEHGIDPDAIVLTGSSAGAHLTAMAALTAGNPTFQPGFESADTAVAAAVGFYGYYGALGSSAVPSTPLAYDATDAPPFLIVHGTNDTYTPIEGARALATHLRARSSNPVVLAELPGAQHSFDVAHSIRYSAVVDAVEAFALQSQQRQKGCPAGSLPTARRDNHPMRVEP